jgi:DNA-binding response OmpR family regulator
MDHEGRGLKSQMKKADRLGAARVALLGEDELAKGTWTLRDMARSTQEGVPEDELVARLRAVLRRAGGRASPILTCGDLVLDPVQHKVTRAGQAIRLTAREFALLQFLLEHVGEPVSRTRIVEAVWEHDYDTFSNVVEVYIRYLRRKVDEPFSCPLIHTVRGVGYEVRPGP